MIESKEFLDRIVKIQNKCKENDLDAFIVTSSDNLYYMTGKSCFPFERPFILIIWADKKPTYFIPRLELEHMSVIEHLDDFVTYYEYPAPEIDSWPYLLDKTLKDCIRIGTDQYTRSEIFSFLNKKFEVESYDWVYTQRFIKSEAEIALIKEVSKYAKDSMRGFIKSIRNGSFVLASLEPGKKAQQKALIDNKFDIDYLAADFISAAWPAPQSAEPHSIPNITAEYGDGPNVIILSYRLNGYATELERTFFTSKPSEVMKKNFNHMLEARKIAFSMIKPGVAAADVDEAVRKYQFKNGLEEYVIHRVGHGMGVSNHEGPFVAIGSPTILEEGMVITVEPGIYFKGMGAFRHSDTVLITKDGYEILTDSPDDIDSLTVNRKIGFLTKIKQSYIRKLIK